MLNQPIPLPRMVAKPPKLNKNQRARLGVLEPSLRACLRTADVDSAKKIVMDIQQLLRPTGHITRLLQAKNWLYECALDAGEVEFACAGFVGTRQLASPDTRLHLEATALLAVCYIRKRNIIQAEMLISEAIRKINNITSDKRRRQFHERLITRFEEESILAGLMSADAPHLNIEEIDREAVKLIRSKTDNELYEQLGNLLPSESVLLLETVRTFSEKRLPAPDRKYLPAPLTREKPKELGKRATVALKRVAWRAVCDPKSELYQAWNQGLSLVYDKKYITGAIVAACASWQIGTVMVVATLVALIVKFGASFFCEMFVPDGIMIDRNEK